MISRSKRSTIASVGTMPVTDPRREIQPKSSIRTSHPAENAAHTMSRASVGRTALIAMTTIDTSMAAR